MIRVGFGLVLGLALSSAAGPFSVAPFSADITIPLGHACMGGGIEPAKEIVNPLQAHGLVLLGGDAPIVFCALDWCEVRNEAYDRFRDALAEAAGTARERVLLASVHQHDAPVVDLEAQRLLDGVGLPKALCDVAFFEEAVGRVAAALNASLAEPIPVTHYGAGAAMVEKVASNRRTVSAEGVATYNRTSSTPDPVMHAAPEDLIDPWLRTLSFWNGDRPVAAIHTYSVHPMSYYGKGGVSYDFCGMARERRREDDPSVHQIYFSGCSGDTVAGKFNPGRPEDRGRLAKRMYDGMVHAWERTERFPLEQLRFTNVSMQLPARDDEAYTVAAMEGVLNNAEAKTFDRNLAAMGLSWRKRVDAGQAIDVPAVDLGRAQFLVMPAEAFVGYQLHAQTIRPDTLVLVAGYGECAPGYIPTQSASSERFNEHHTWCWVPPGVEPVMHEAMAKALAGQ